MSVGRPTHGTFEVYKMGAPILFIEQEKEEEGKRESVRPEKFQFMEKEQNRNFGYKIVISAKNPKFILWILDDEIDFTIGIVSRNLASTSNFVEFRDSRNLHIFRSIAVRVS